MEYVKSDSFIEICYECEFDIAKIAKALVKLKPGYNARADYIRSRIGNYRRKGLLPLDSGNSISTGEILKGTSTQYGPNGEIKQQWVKTDVDKTQALASFTEAIASLTNSLPARASTPSPNPLDLTEDTMSVYTIGDAHVGMLAWDKETGEDYDLAISQSRHVEAMSLLVQQANPSREAFIIDVGDFFHSDNTENRTAASGAPLDVDGRYAKVLEIGLYLTTVLIDKALTKHETVHWRSAIGNHNEHSALMMNQFIKAYYRNEPRVIVHDEAGMFMYHQFGKNLIGITHGHKVKAEKLGEIMAVDAKDLWSETEYRYWYTGHVHHQSVKEFPSCVVETFRTLAGKDAWHTASGYRSGQDMKCITLHKDYGEISRNTVNAHQVTQSLST